MTMILDGTLGITATGSLTGLTTAITPAQGGTGLTAVGTAGNLLTSNGTAWTSTAPAASGGMTVLGTLTTTSGTSQTLSGLTLTTYKQLHIAVNNVGFASGASGSTLNLDSVATTRVSMEPGACAFGTLILDISIGCFTALGVGAPGSNFGTSGLLSFGNLSSITTSTTSLVFTFSAGQTFSTGTIKVYGVS
jgi:hypothetical protein